MVGVRKEKPFHELDLSRASDVRKFLETTYNRNVDADSTQEEMVKSILERLTTNKKFQQLGLMSTNKQWKRECKNPEYTILDIEIEERLERLFLFKIRGDDGYGGFYNGDRFEFKQSPGSMFENYGELFDVVKQFPKTGNNTIQKLLNNIADEANVDSARVKNIVHALKAGAFHIMMPFELNDLIIASHKQKETKQTKRLSWLLENIKTGMDRFAVVEDYPRRINGVFNFFVIRPEFISSQSIVETNRVVVGVSADDDEISVSDDGSPPIKRGRKECNTPETSPIRTKTATSNHVRVTPTKTRGEPGGGPINPYYKTPKGMCPICEVFRISFLKN